MVNMLKLGKFELTMDADFKVMRVNNSADSLDKSATSNDVVDISRIPVCIRKFLLFVIFFCIISQKTSSLPASSLTLLLC